VGDVPRLAKVDHVPDNDWQPLTLKKLGKGSTPFRNAVADFYLTNPIARASELMAELSANARSRTETPVAAE